MVVTIASEWLTDGGRAGGRASGPTDWRRVAQDSLTGRLGRELVPVRGADGQQPVAEVKIVTGLCCYLADNL